MSSVAMKRLAVFCIREFKGGSLWTRAGTAFVNKDGSFNVILDVLPLDGKLHVREAGEKRDTLPQAPLRATAESALESAAAGVHG